MTRSRTPIARRSWHGRPSTHRPGPILDFVNDDVRQGGVLIATLSEYVACDLNARRAAERLHIHVNTAHYRLGRIAARTGCDVHRFADLVQILIAARYVATSL